MDQIGLPSEISEAGSADFWDDWKNFLTAAQADEAVNEFRSCENICSIANITDIVANYSPERHGIVVCGERIMPRHNIPKEEYDILNKRLAESKPPTSAFKAAFSEELPYVHSVCDAVRIL